MAAFARAISQLPGGSLITLDYFHHGRDRIVSLLEETLMLDRELSSLLTMLLPKLPSVDGWKAVSTVVAFHTAFLC